MHKQVQQAALSQGQCGRHCSLPLVEPIPGRLGKKVAPSDSDLRRCLERIGTQHLALHEVKISIQRYPRPAAQIGRARVEMAEEAAGSLQGLNIQDQTAQRKPTVILVIGESSMHDHMLVVLVAPALGGSSVTGRGNTLSIRDNRTPLDSKCSAALG